VGVDSPNYCRMAKYLTNSNHRDRGSFCTVVASISRDFRTLDGHNSVGGVEGLHEVQAVSGLGEAN